MVIKYKKLKGNGRNKRKREEKTCKTSSTNESAATLTLTRFLVKSSGKILTTGPILGAINIATC